MRNGIACRITVVFAVLAFLNLFQSWEPDYFGIAISGAFFARSPKDNA